MFLKNWMAFMYYPVAVAGTYFIGRNILYRGTSFAIDYILNTNADPDIKETHTVQTIESMLNQYILERNHPAYESRRSLKLALDDLKDAVNRARLKLGVHEGGWLTRFRTFDARADNTIIESKAKELMHRLEIFTKLIQLPVGMNNPMGKPFLTVVDDYQDQYNKNDKKYTE